MSWRYIFIAVLVIAVGFVFFFVKSELLLDTKQLRFLMPKDENYDVLWQEGVEEFERIWNKKHPNEKIDIVYEPVGTNVAPKLNTQVVANTLPDIVFIHRTTFYTFAKNGVFLDLRPFIEKNNDREYLHQIYPQLIEYNTIDSKIYGLPISVSSEVLYYNKALFDREGIPYPDENWAWEDMREAAIKLTKRDAQGRALQFGLVWNPFRPAYNTLKNGGKFFCYANFTCF